MNPLQVLGPLGKALGVKPVRTSIGTSRYAQPVEGVKGPKIGRQTRNIDKDTPFNGAKAGDLVKETFNTAPEEL